MQTFVPSSNVVENARVLDRLRLGKQRVECLQILRTLRGLSTGWKNHPATRMWDGYENALCNYGAAICSEWIRRGYKDTCYQQIMSLYQNEGSISLPDWWGGPIHASHRASLLHRNLQWYTQFGWTESPSDKPLFWPVPLLSATKL